jgi:uncharacterized surface protein with fasciclin (FAS1) repeats
VVPAVLIALSACGSSAPSSTGAPSSRAAVSNPTVPAATVPASTAPFGPGCAALAAIRSAQLTGLTAERVTSAATHHLALSSLVAAVSKAQLADSLDSQQNVTVLAPANAAFRAFPRATLTALLGDTPRLTRLLTHHVIEGRLTPQQLAGTHTTLANDTVTIAASGGTFTISGDQTVLRSRPATVVCGNIRTANATVYIIDQVLAPRG